MHNWAWPITWESMPGSSFGLGRVFTILPGVAERSGEMVPRSGVIGNGPDFVHFGTTGAGICSLIFLIANEEEQ